MSSLKELVYQFRDFLRTEGMRVVFYKSKNGWDSLTFKMKRYNSSLDGTEIILEEIKKKDPKAVVLYGDTYVGKDLDNLIYHAMSDIEYYHEKENSCHNIGVFIERHGSGRNQKQPKDHKPMTSDDLIQCLEDELRRLIAESKHYGKNTNASTSKQIFTIATYLLDYKKG